MLHSHTAGSPPAKGLGHVLPAQQPGAGQRPCPQPPSAPGRDGPADAEGPPAPSPGRAAHPRPRCAFFSFAIGLFRLCLRITRFTSYKVLLMGNTMDVHQKLFSANQQITRVKKATLWLTDPSTWTGKSLRCSFDLTLQVSALTRFKRKWLQLKSPTTVQSFDAIESIPLYLILTDIFTLHP